MRYKLEAYCSTNWRCTVAFPTALQMGGVLRYKLEVYRQYFSGKSYGLGVPKQSPIGTCTGIGSLSVLCGVRGSVPRKSKTACKQVPRNALDSFRDFEPERSRRPLQRAKVFATHDLRMWGEPWLEEDECGLCKSWSEARPICEQLLGAQTGPKVLQGCVCVCVCVLTVCPVLSSSACLSVCRLCSLLHGDKVQRRSKLSASVAQKKWLKGLHVFQSVVST